MEIRVHSHALRWRRWKEATVWRYPHHWARIEWAPIMEGASHLSADVIAVGDETEDG
jgi:hypothetical protein